MEIIRSDDLTAQLDDLVVRVADGSERVIVTHRGKQIALVPFEDLTFLEEVDHRLDERDAAEIDRRRADPKEVPQPFCADQAAAQST